MIKLHILVFIGFFESVLTFMEIGFVDYVILIEERDQSFTFNIYFVLEFILMNVFFCPFVV